jgi:hypothetical protein
MKFLFLIMLFALTFSNAVAAGWFFRFGLNWFALLSTLSCIYFAVFTYACLGESYETESSL